MIKKVLIGAILFILFFSLRYYFLRILNLRILERRNYLGINQLKGILRDIRFIMVKNLVMENVRWVDMKAK